MHTTTTTTTTLRYLVKDKVLALEEAAVWECLHVAVNATLQLVHILDALGLHVHRRLFTTNATSAVHEDLQQDRQGETGVDTGPKVSGKYQLAMEAPRAGWAHLLALELVNVVVYKLGVL